MASLFVSYFDRLAQWTKALAKRKTATYWLCFLSFIESSFFPLPADIILIPMVAAQKTKAYFYAFIASVSSVLGTILGWAIGRFFFEIIALPILEFYGKSESFFHLQSNYNMNFIIILLFAAGFTHIPPIKIVTILAGTINMPLSYFLLASFVTRFGRFYLLAWLVKMHSEKIVNFFLKRFAWIASATCVLFITGYILFK